ncbi:hypothetical protein TYRP_018749 [Tyrophagus putrescentiae]|nr:hypothetical protein TYRP_018749 [Tyrophagus putrescentiae]
MHSLAVHGTRRRGLAPLGRCQLPLPRASRAKRAGPEAAEVDSGQAMSGIPQQCTAQGGEVWHLLGTVNFRCLWPRERSERGQRQRKFTVPKRCRVSRRHSSAVHGTKRRGLAPLGRCQLPLPRASRAKRAGPEAAEVDSGQAMSGEPPVK